MSRVVLVTGSNRGIGLELVNQLSQRGFEVIMTARNEDAGKAAAAGFNRDNIHVHQLDLTSDESISQLKSWIENKFGRLDILINNAAINYDTWNKAESADMANVRETFDTNLFGTWSVCIAMIPLIKKSSSGRIVNVSSGAGSLNEMIAEAPGYSFSKAALNGLTIQLARELKMDKILVNSVCPGWVKTELGGIMAPRTVEEGAESILQTALLEDGGPTGGFFRDGEKLDW